jgi:NAD(P)-dependent dehydrogenase (short-subunit alcohol dehydrogenase family)
VLTSSVGAYEGQKGQAAYAAPRARIVGGIAPGVFDTPFMDILSDEAKATLCASIPRPSRLGKSSEYAALVRQSAEDPLLNGETIRPDGALRLGMR